MERFSIRNIKQSSITFVTLCISLAIVAQFYGYVSPSIQEVPPIERDLSGKWEICLPSEPSPQNCKWTETLVPTDLSNQLSPQLHGWILYRKRFTAPASCLTSSASCSLFFGEVGDSAEATLNGIALGRRGDFPPAEAYAKHYPVKFDLSRDLLQPGENANQLTLTVYSLKRVQAGIRRGPVGIFSSGNGFKVAQSFVAVTVFVPLLGFLGLFLLALITASVTFAQKREETSLHAYIRFCLINCLFLLSFSEIPREYLPISFAGYIHFTLRLLSDWAYFEFIREYFSFGNWTRKWLRPLYFVPLTVLAVELIQDLYSGGIFHGGTDFDDVYFIIRMALPILLLPHIMGIVASLRQWNSRYGRVFFCYFTGLLAFQIHDSLIFHGFMTGTYAVKIYPFFTGLIMGLCFLERFQKERNRMLLEQEKASQMKRVYEFTRDLAHEFRSPLAGIQMGCYHLLENPENPALVRSFVTGFSEPVDRLFKLTNAILEYSKELSKDIQLNKQEVDLQDFMQSICDRFSASRDRKKEISIQLEAPKKPVIATIDLFQIDRVFTNLLLNASEASPDRSCQVKIVIRDQTVLNPRIEITFVDNGPGISREIRDQLFEPFVTHGKAHGIGLGLTLSKKLIEAHQGTIQFNPLRELGTEFRICIPK